MDKLQQEINDFHEAVKLIKRVKKQVRYPQILREEDIATCNNSTLEAVLFFALCNMIGKGETGLYPELNENWEEIELAIQEYIACLQKE